MKLGLVTYNLAKDWDVDTIIEKCEKNGYEGVELRTSHGHKVEVDLSDMERQAVRKKFEDSSVAIAGLGSAFAFHSADPEEVKTNIEGTREYVKLAEDVGAPGVKVRPNGLQLDKGIPEEKTLEQIGRSLRECAEFADDFGIEIRIEVHGGDTCRVPRIRKIMDWADHPNAYVCWNSNMADLEDGGFEAAFDLVKDKIGLVHMRDLCSPGYPWRKLVKGLKDIGYEGFCLTEVPANEDPDRIMLFNKALWDAYNDLADLTR